MNLLDETVTIFNEDPETEEAINDWLRGFMKDENLIWRLKYLQERSAERAANNLAQTIRDNRNDCDSDGAA